MATKDTQAKRLAPPKLQKAKDNLIAITQLTDYAPQRKDYTAAKTADMLALLDTTAKAELAAENALAAARDAAAKAEWAAYDFSLSAAEQVQGQYGSDSDQYASLGYKKKSEYKKNRASSPKKTVS